MGGYQIHDNKTKHEKMINENDTATFESYERAISNRLCFNEYKGLNNQKKKELKHKLSSEILQLRDKASLKFYDIPHGIKLNTEYLNFLVRFYNHKTKNESKMIIQRFLKSLDMRFKDLDISNQSRRYRKLISYRYQDCLSNEEQQEVLRHFEDTNPISYILTNGFKHLHFIN